VLEEFEIKSMYRVKKNQFVKGVTIRYFKIDLYKMEPSEDEFDE